MPRLPHRILFFFLLPTVAVAQSSESGLKRDWLAEEPVVTGVDHLAAPMQIASTNLGQLEQSGDLKIIRKEYRAVGTDGRYAMIWTIAAQRPVRFRLVQMHLEKLRHASFQIDGSESRLEAYSKQMFYSRVDMGAASGRRMIFGEEFQVWCYVNADEISQNKLRPIVAVEFQPFRRPRLRY